MIPPCQIPAVASAIECEKNDKTEEKAQQQTPPALHITFAGARAVAVLAVATGWKAFPVGTPLSLLTLAAVRAAAAKVVVVRVARYPVSCTTRAPCRRVMRAAGHRDTAAR
jgi:hypothetical protein